jgi:hypothetical protein
MKYFLFVLTVAVHMSAGAQTAGDSVKAVVTKMFTAMKDADSSALRSVFSASVIFQSVAVNKEGKAVVRNEKADGFIEFVGQQKKGILDERIEFDVVRVDGNLASVWTPYSFYYDGKFSHCGANSFQLVRFHDGWKIQYLVDTRRKDCQ